MNRRSFLSGIIKAGVAAAILPTSITYARKWVKSNYGPIINPDWVNAPYEVEFYYGPPHYLNRNQIPAHTHPFTRNTPLRYKLNESGIYEHVSPFINS